MIRSLSIIENRTENGIVEYAVSGELPLDEAAAALIRIAFSGHADGRQSIIKKEE